MSLHNVDFSRRMPLFDAATSRAIEAQAAKVLAPHTLMQRAGLSIARLVCAIAPHARVILLACGPGNNGGDGLEAAMQLRMRGREAVVTWLGDAASCPEDSKASWQRARDAGVLFADAPPTRWDAAVDALLGIGASRAPGGVMLEWLQRMHESCAPVLCVDLPSGLNADTGESNTTDLIANYDYSTGTYGQLDLKIHTLSLLTLKPGLFTAQGRDACGQIWFDDLGIAHAHSPAAYLLGHDEMQIPPRLHASHKGSYGDVAVIGGAAGMQGAALLAARAALHAGAGRVFVGLLQGGLQVDLLQPELMLRDVHSLDLAGKTVVCGCGGGQEVRKVLARVISGSEKLVLDADALNAIAQDASLQSLLTNRARKQQPTILTPHPLEAARLLGNSAALVQADRLQAAQTLADRFACTVILKGSGSIIASPDEPPCINPTGDARLATAGTGDVLAGICGALLAQSKSAHEAAQRACWQHGALASDRAASERVLTASQLLIDR
jgi:ADP-dependent NAD(P)H-hydrate dehydratase / NAD(P)H-hydrate epimerase